MEIQNLTDDEINRKVAELMGWVWFESHNQHGYWQYPSDRTKDLWSCNMHRFSASLDACATFEATITEKVEQSDYAEKVIQAVSDERHGQHRFIGTSDFYRITATPRQRCIAFLRMKGVL